MAEATETQTLSGLLDELAKAEDGGPKVKVEAIYEAVGRRAFGPLLLVPGLLAMTPVGVIPGAPTALAVMVILIAGQLLIGRKTFWLPHAMLKLEVKRERLEQALKVLRRPAGIIDRVLRPRLCALTSAWGARAVAAVCVLMALAIPPLEFVPFAVFAPAAAVSAFGLGLLARDGVVILLAHLVSLGSLGLAARAFL